MNGGERFIWQWGGGVEELFLQVVSCSGDFEGTFLGVTLNHILIGLNCSNGKQRQGLNSFLQTVCVCISVCVTERLCV